MRSSRKKMKVTTDKLVSLLPGCTKILDVRAGESINSYVVMSHVEMDVALGTALFDMYAKCGKIDKIVVVSNSMDGKNLQSCTVMMKVLADHGRHKDVFSLFNHMEVRLQPDSLVFAVILSACSHTGLVCEGRRYFDRMVRMYGIKPSVEHYGCMVDLLGRSGLIQEAYDIIKGMPMVPNGVILRSFLAACRNHGWVPSLDADLLSELEHELGAAAIDPDGPILSADDLADQIA
ncbi:pentatricopeptide repeat-containing protein At1g26900, mitochondrial-like [Vigna radiata var. radiata]|uniref:Pentatricopeptide repeat-containing protein At1g26900, mitochondrial-like n=1 Tax=Vigna radiata var. radiata TaxID=3916 RepID=A0A1S3TZZ4_VIGRR|nr:pentatricopeptide repeat-containing protein At1g26900, mitochondrial-like [Vigna radiata var. radiata]